MQIKLVYHGKTINLTSDNTVITSTNFSVDKNGNIIAKSGTIGGFTLGTTQFSNTINGTYNYNIYDVRTTQGIVLDYLSTTTILSSLYDIDGNGDINIKDAQEMLKVDLGTSTSTKKISGTFQINSSDPKNFISIKNGSNLAVSIGVGGVNTHLLSAENIICTTQSTLNNFTGVAINGNIGVIYAKNFSNTSLESIKKNITKFGDAIEIIKNSEIYEYNFRNEKDTDKKHVGFVIGDKYKTPNKIISQNKTGIESYTMSSIEWRALQQIIEIVEKICKKVEI